MNIEDIKVGMTVIMCVPEGEACYLGRCGIRTGEVGIVQHVFQSCREVGVIYPDWIPSSSAMSPDYRKDEWFGKDYEFAIEPDWWDIWAN